MKSLVCWQKKNKVRFSTSLCLLCPQEGSAAWGLVRKVFSLSCSIQAQSKDFNSCPLVNKLILEGVHARSVLYMAASTEDKPDSLWQCGHAPLLPTAKWLDQSLVTSVHGWEYRCSWGIWCYVCGGELGLPTVLWWAKEVGGNPRIRMEGCVVSWDMFL